MEHSMRPFLNIKVRRHTLTIGLFHFLHLVIPQVFGIGLRNQPLSD